MYPFKKETNGDLMYCKDVVSVWIKCLSDLNFRYSLEIELNFLGWEELQSERRRAVKVLKKC